MNEIHEHLITQNIKAFYKRRLPSPIIYLVLLIILWFVFPLGKIISPPAIDDSSNFESLYKSSVRYGKLELNDLRFTGYTSKDGNITKGYYYYCMRGDNCSIILLDPSTCEQGLPTIEELSVVAKLQKGGSSYSEMIDQLAIDLEWTSDGLRNSVTNYYFSEPDYHMSATVIMFIFYFGSGLYALICLVLYLLYISFPFLSPTCQNLIVFGHPIKMLEEAEEELATLPQLATEDMFITEHYFIVTSPYGNSVVPINEIMWIYKHSTLHKFLWYHFSISYTLHIAANKHLYIQCPKNIKSDIDGIIDYLAEANHQILVGFSEENRLKVQAKQGKPLHIERWLAFRNRKS